MQSLVFLITSRCQSAKLISHKNREDLILEFNIEKSYGNFQNYINLLNMNVLNQKLWKKIGSIRGQALSPEKSTLGSLIPNNSDVFKIKGNQKQENGSKQSVSLQEYHLVSNDSFVSVSPSISVDSPEKQCPESFDLTFAVQYDKTQSIPNKAEKIKVKERGVEASCLLQFQLNEFKLDLIVLRENVGCLLEKTQEEFEQFKKMMGQKMDDCKKQFESQLKWERGVLEENSILKNQIISLSTKNERLKQQITDLQEKNQQLLKQLNQTLQRYWQKLENRQKIKKYNFQLQKDVMTLKKSLHETVYRPELSTSTYIPKQKKFGKFSMISELHKFTAEHEGSVSPTLQQSKMKQTTYCSGYSGYSGYRWAHQKTIGSHKSNSPNKKI